MGHFRSKRVYKRAQATKGRNVVRVRSSKKYFYCQDCKRQKFRYSQKEAETALKFQKQVCRSYRCPTCSKEEGKDIYHLTSKK